MKRDIRKEFFGKDSNSPKRTNSEALYKREYKSYVKAHNRLFLKPVTDRGLLDIPFGTNRYYANEVPLRFNQYKAHRSSGGTFNELIQQSKKSYTEHEKSGNVPSDRTI